MELVRLDPKALSRYPHQFSGGQRQRICIARALAMKPDVFVADEIVPALDVTVQAAILALLNDIRERLNLAILFITHDLRVAAQVCHEVIVMHKGKVVEQGETAKIFADPQHAYTKKFLASVPGRDWSFASQIAADIRSYGLPEECSPFGLTNCRILMFLKIRLMKEGETSPLHQSSSGSPMAPR